MSGSSRSPSTVDQNPPPKRLKSNIDSTALLHYKSHFVARLHSLGVVLGVEEATAILDSSATVETKYLQITEQWMRCTAIPTWKIFSSCLSKCKDFTHVRTLIEQEQLERHKKDEMGKPSPSRVRRGPPRNENSASKRGKSNIDKMGTPSPSMVKRSPSRNGNSASKRGKSNIVTQDEFEATNALTDEEEVDQLEQFKRVKKGSVIWMQVGIRGAGKSCLGNFILGQDDSFPESSIMAISETDKAALKCSSFDNENLCVIDTPGLGDTGNVGSFTSDAEDVAYDYSKLATELTKVMMMMDQGINAFLIVVQGNTRDYRGLQALLDFCDIIGAYWNHSILVVTHGKEFGNTEEEQYATYREKVLAHPKCPALLKKLLGKVSGRLVIAESKDWRDRPEYHRSVVGKIMKYSKEITERHGPFQDEVHSIGRVAREKAKLELRNEFENFESSEAQKAIYQSTFKHVKTVIRKLVSIKLAEGEDIDKLRQMSVRKEEELDKIHQRKEFQDEKKRLRKEAEEKLKQAEIDQILAEEKRKKAEVERDSAIAQKQEADKNREEAERKKEIADEDRRAAELQSERAEGVRRVAEHADLHLPDDSSPPSPPPPPPPPTWMEQYEKAIEKRGSVTLHITRCVLIGPPRVGKSSLKLLLINNEPKGVEKSTDLMEAPVVLTSIQCQDKKGSQWKELKPDELQQLVIKCTREEEYDPAQPNPSQSSHTTQLTPEGSNSTAVAPDIDNYDVSTTVTVVKSSTQKLRHHNTASEEESFAKLKVEGLEAKYDNFTGKMDSGEFLADLEMNGLKIVHVFDCGGQLAFQDTIPLLINAPCAFISVFNASIDLDEEVEQTYCPEKNVELSLGYKESQWNMLRRIFSSIHSLQFKCHDDISHLIKDKTVVPSSPVAVVGTHKDVLQEASENDRGLRQRNTENKIKEHLDRLRDSKLYDFLREGCTHDLVANLSKDDLSAIECLRNDITESKATLPLQLPLSWIILELFTRSLENKFIPFHDLQQLCFHKDIVKHKEEFSSLLQVLHVLGFYAFYQLDGVPEDSDQNWVCTDAATLYSEVTKILMVQYKKNLKGATIELQQYGRLKLNKATLQDVFTDLEMNIDGADPMWFIRVLLHIGLAAKIEDEGEEEAFIPLALPFKHSDLPLVTSVATICFTLEFPSGARESRVRANVTEIPRGIFPRLIVYLLSPQCLKEFKWQVDKGDSRSRIKLIHHSKSREYVIYLSEHVDHIELNLVLNGTYFIPTQHYFEHNTQVRTLCQELREHLKSALGDTFVSVFGEQPLERRPSVVCGLKCSACHDSSHMAIVRPADESTPQHPLYTEECVRPGPNLEFVENPGQLIWFSPKKETTPQFERKTFRTKDGQSKIWVMKGTLESDLANRPSAKDLRDISHKTGENSKDLLRSLEIEEARIATFVMDNSNNSAEACYQGLMFWENENALLPVTWGTLKAALKKAQLTKLANELPPKEK